MPSLIAALFVLAAAASPDDPCRPADKTRIRQNLHLVSLVHLEWPEAEAGETSRLEVSTDPEFARRPLINKAVCCSAKLRGLELGTYYWRVMVEPAEREACRASFEVVGFRAE